ncbi:hypothetical protein CI610_00311 [invertebrate metagenome]|uniref:Uncharacterized protein n=1 Tax=invertebrate metagenome TaxID=1711999 RepID=A0A2H9T7W5_9ZZZZ
MDADEALGELKIRNHAGFKKVLEAVRDALRDTDFEDNLYTLDQG